MSYNIPEDIDHLFRVGEAQWSIVDYSDFPGEMNNIASMQFFLQEVGVEPDNIVDADGTQVIVCHPQYPFNLVIDAGGLGDTYSHCFEVSHQKEEKL